VIRAAYALEALPCRNPQPRRFRPQALELGLTIAAGYMTTRSWLSKMMMTSRF
jgi:hypothetical protein